MICLFSQIVTLQLTPNISTPTTDNIDPRKPVSTSVSQNAVDNSSPVKSGPNVPSPSGSSTSAVESNGASLKAKDTTPPTSNAIENSPLPPSAPAQQVIDIPVNPPPSLVIPRFQNRPQGTLIKSISTVQVQPTITNISNSTVQTAPENNQTGTIIITNTSTIIIISVASVFVLCLLVLLVRIVRKRIRDKNYNHRLEELRDANRFLPDSSKATWTKSTLPNSTLRSVPYSTMSKTPKKPTLTMKETNTAVRDLFPQSMDYDDVSEIGKRRTHINSHYTINSQYDDADNMISPSISYKQSWFKQ